ncbi:MAG TPA: HNH endonuclease [Candidatus Baltobacteraceae bacterium]|jgi:5-methylcytosine-specific restriction endonuclease McrA|nr:HNH endonuclease [Candidatus Baltobacteraceae bacterium]
MSSVLVLNFTYEALNVTNLQRAVRLIHAGKAEVVKGNGLVRSPTFALPLPSIIRMLYYIRQKKRPVSLTKKNVLLRDDFRCQYCGDKGERDLTVDHVIPRRAGGAATWENLVACCYRCNQRKRDRTPSEAKMPLRRAPKRPSYIPWLVIRRNTEGYADWASFLRHELSIEERVG